MKKNNIFTRIINKQIKSDILYQDDIITIFKDIFPKYPVHVLIVPNKKIKNLNAINNTNQNILNHMLIHTIKIAKKLKIHKTGYKVLINCNKGGGQEIPHLHIHLMGGVKK
ncbi:HIT domain-containing protein [Buchnera aphidicola (Kurisakia onigurumii)]|uniref:HIT domain-containing protein n=1 Tax=Buchnera aphidicola TaxID=9 RepID=UPI0031B6F3D7